MFARKSMILGDDVGLGKCVAEGSLVLTSEGYRRIEDLDPPKEEDSLRELELDLVGPGRGPGFLH